MPTKYSKADIQTQVKAAMQDVGELYRETFINWTGRTVDADKQLYSEVIAEELLQSNISVALQNLPAIQRKKYSVETHDGNIEKQTNRKEEILAKNLYAYCKNNQLGCLGTIFDYQVPLKSISCDKAGKIDLVSFNRKNNRIWLLELKTENSTETLLRCIMEIATYHQLLHKGNFIASYSTLPINISPQCIRKAILVFKHSKQNAELDEIKAGNRPNLEKIANLLDISFFLLEKLEPNYQVTKVKL